MPETWWILFFSFFLLHVHFRITFILLHFLPPGGESFVGQSQLFLGMLHEMGNDYPLTFYKSKGWKFYSTNRAKDRRAHVTDEFIHFLIVNKGVITWKPQHSSIHARAPLPHIEWFCVIGIIDLACNARRDAMTQKDDYSSIQWRERVTKFKVDRL